MILGKLKADAEAKLGEKITQTMITVPASDTTASNGTRG
jgi:molecular chaperone DnaK (HSP70)